MSKFKVGDEVEVKATRQQLTVKWVHPTNKVWWAYQLSDGKYYSSFHLDSIRPYALTPINE